MLSAQQTIGNVFFDNQHPSIGDCRDELLAGLRQPQKTLNPKFFYNEAGSKLFEKIMRLPEYYPTRTEVKMLQQYAGEIAEVCGQGGVLIEPGSGNSEKVEYLLKDLKPSAYVPLDISADFLHSTAMRLGDAYPWLQVHAICADFSQDWQMPESLPQGNRLVYYPGSTIGNLNPDDAVSFLNRVSDWVGTEGGLLIGVDLHKSEDILHAAYNDADGVTEAFNLNALHSINPLLDANFDADNFAHKAFYNQDKRRIEMHLVSQSSHDVKCGEDVIRFDAGETIHTESSYKYTTESFSDLAERAGLTRKHGWVDDDGLFSMHYLTPA
ncbi:Histidine N-alpha-methyltransferase [BD1-7 clade bacterium]|uniref:Histidine N-alpha-methyltransferase n=1 Tax=BD1-7 clade bacterium TaxID=2029982 RepID=A0A5S9QJB9_9GAMM|nr:Histidine N-alpha-methyltransferase [BD1-7 clade bacterium]CAA0118951.1 Histidine N-alpha-methyltransferase [BD1-7 clade bacterium]